MPYARNGDLRIHYEVEGDGPPLVLQHGYSGSIRRWYFAGYVQALRRDFRLILIDARGHGASDKPHDPGAYTLDAQVQDVCAVLDAVGVARAHYWGYSMGGRIGFALVRGASNRLHHLIIGGAHPYARTLPPGQRPDGSDPDAFLRALYGRTGADLDALPPEYRQELYANDFQALAAGQQDWPSLEHVLPRIIMPTFLYVGARDPYVAKMRTLVEKIPGGRLVELPDLDHGTAFRESAQVLPQVQRFLNQKTAGTQTSVTGRTT